jgi:hypothetical protein
VSSGVCHDIERLHPAFRARVELVLADMREAGHDPVIWETYRTPERAKQLEERGASKNGAKSIHCYADDAGRVGAVDVISESKMWFRGDAKGAKAFFGDLHEIAERHGLYVIDWDGPHLQFLPVKPGPQNAYRALTPKARGEFIQRVCG